MRLIYFVPLLSALPKKCEQSTGALTPQGQGAGAGGPSVRASRGPGLTPALAHSRVAAAHALASLHAGGGGGRPPGRCGWRLDVRVPGSPGPERVRPPQVSPEVTKINRVMLSKLNITPGDGGGDRKFSILPAGIQRHHTHLIPQSLFLIDTLWLVHCVLKCDPRVALPWQAVFSSPRLSVYSKSPLPSYSVSPMHAFSYFMPPSFSQSFLLVRPPLRNSPLSGQLFLIQ